MSQSFTLSADSANSTFIDSKTGRSPQFFAGLPLTILVNLFNSGVAVPSASLTKLTLEIKRPNTTQSGQIPLSHEPALFKKELTVFNSGSAQAVFTLTGAEAEFRDSKIYFVIYATDTGGNVTTYATGFSQVRRNGVHGDDPERLNLYASGSDGSVFFYESNGEAYAKTVDKDGNENNFNIDTAKVKAEQDSLRETHTIYILAIGQSNMERGGDQYGTASWDNHPDDRVEILNTSTNNFEAWDLGKPTQNNAISSQSPAATAQASTIPYHFAKHIARVTGLRVRIIASAKSGQPISYWGAKTDGSAHDPTAAGWQTLLSQLNYAPKIDCVLWHQGESNSSSSKAEYLTAFQQITQTIYSLSKVKRDAPIIAGDYIAPEYGTTAREALIDLNTQKATYPYFSFVRQQFSPDSVTGQAIHYSDNSIAEFGKNYAQEYLRGVDSVKTPLTNRLSPDQQAFEVGRQSHINAATPKSIRISITLPANNATDFALDLAHTTHQGGATAVRGLRAVIFVQKYNTNWNVSSFGNKFNHNGIKTSIENATSTSADIVIKFAHTDTTARTLKSVLSYNLLQKHANAFRNMSEDILNGIVSLNFAEFDEADPLYLYGGSGTTDF